MGELKSPDGDELLFAQLACSRLIGRLQGVVSIGLPALVTRVPDPREFLQDRYRAVIAHAVVLDTVCWPAGNVDEIMRLREKSSRLLALLEDLQCRLFAALDSSGPVFVHLRKARQTAVAVFDAAEDLAAIIQMSDTRIRSARAAVVQVFDALETFDSSPVSPVG